MGQSANGRLVFGFKVGEEDEIPEFLAAYEGDLDYLILAKAGLSESRDWHLRNATVEACVADMERLGTYDYCQHVLCVRGLKLSAEWSETVVITPELLTVPPEKIAEFKAWCDANGVPWQEPQWLLSSFFS